MKVSNIDRKVLNYGRKDDGNSRTQCNEIRVHGRLNIQHVVANHYANVQYSKGGIWV